MKLLHAEIRNCRECPFCYGDSVPTTIAASGYVHVCWHTRRNPIVPDSGIPDWCPLPDAAAKEPEEYPETCPECGQSMER
jgi:hypothetical protein